MTIRATSAAFPLLPLILGACASVPPPQDAAVARLVSERADLSLVRAAHDDAETLAALDALLADGLAEHEAPRVALLANREVQAALAGLDVARGDFARAVAGSNPELEGEWLDTDDGSVLELALVQDVVDLMLRPRRRGIAESQLQASVLAVAEQVLDLAARARLAWIDAAAAQQMVELRATVAEAAAASYELAVRLREAGNVRRLDLLLERSLHEEARLELAAAERAAARAREQLNAVLGLWGERTAWTLAGDLPDLPADLPHAADVERRAVEASLDLAGRLRGLQAASGQVDLARASSWLPSAELGLKAEREDGEWSFGPAFLLPLPILSQGGPARLRSRAALEREAELLRAAAVRLRSQARASAYALEALHDEARHVREVLVPLRHEITGQMLLQYNAMQVGTFELLAVRREEIRAGIRYVASLHAFWRARIAVDALLAGGRPPEGTPASVEAPGGSMDIPEERPGAH